MMASTVCDCFFSLDRIPGTNISRIRHSSPAYNKKPSSFTMGWLLLAVVQLGIVASAAIFSAGSARDTVARTPDVDEIMSNPEASFKSYSQGNLIRDVANSLGTEILPAITPNRFQWNCTTSPVFTWGDSDNGGMGVFITNADTTNWQAFFVYHNMCDYVPFKYIWIGAGLTQFVSMPPLFEGRIVRGNDEVISHPEVNFHGCEFADTWVVESWRHIAPFGNVVRIFTRQQLTHMG